MAANAGDISIVGNTITDALALNNQSESANHLATQAVSLFENRDPSQDREFKDAALLDLVNRNLLPGLAWAEAGTLDRNGDQIIQMGEANELMNTGDLFQQLAAEFMSKADRDVSLDELALVKEQILQSQPLGGQVGPAPTGELPVLPSTDVMQFTGDPAQLTSPVDDPVQRYFAESQFLASQFENLDGDKNGTVDVNEMNAGFQNQLPEVQQAADIAMQHRLMEKNGGYSFTLQNVIDDGLPTQAANLMQFSGDTAPQIPAPDPALLMSEDPVQRHMAEAQYLASQFQNLDANQDGTVSFPELVTASQTPNEDILKAVDIASRHGMTAINGGAYTSFTMQDVINDAQPPQYGPAAEQPSDLDVLSAPGSSVMDRLKAVKSLVENGQTSQTITDANGNQLNVRMEVIPIEGSSRSMVQMFAIDPDTGKEFVVLRAISDGDTFTHQKDAHGQDVDFVGTRWQRNHPDSMFSTSSES